jgi:hypothetical protein
VIRLGDFRLWKNAVTADWPSTLLGVSYGSKRKKQRGRGDIHEKSFHPNSPVEVWCELSQPGFNAFWPKHLVSTVNDSLLKKLRGRHPWTILSGDNGLRVFRSAEICTLYLTLFVTDELNFLSCNFGKDGQAVLDLQYFDLAMLQLSAVANKRAPRRMERFVVGLCFCRPDSSFLLIIAIVHGFGPSINLHGM